MINTWQFTLLDLGSLKTGLSLRINATFVLGAVILLAVKFIQDGGILRSANTTKILGISAMIPLLLIGIVPILTGDIVSANYFPLAPLAHDAAGIVLDRLDRHFSGLLDDLLRCLAGARREQARRARMIFRRYLCKRSVETIEFARLQAWRRDAGK